MFYPPDDFYLVRASLVVVEKDETDVARQLRRYLSTVCTG